MIRINLIQAPGQQTAETKSAAAFPASAKKQGLVVLVSAAICCVMVFFFYWLWSHQITDLNRQMAMEKAEAARLARIQAENQKYHAELTAIQSHIGIIQGLNNNRQGPRDLMTALGNTVNRTNGLYLVSVKGESGELKIHGQSKFVDSIADFIAALKQTGPFANVQLQRLFEDDQKDLVSFTFDLTCAYKPPAAQTSAPARPARGARALLR